MIICVNESEKELTVKRSRFIAISKRIDTREEVKPFIDRLKREHAEARHVCYGYIADEKGDDFGYDDDGEPSGTAGKPIYSALAAAEARKTCIAVVRYFGGIKLGAGGLTRVYRQSAAELIAAAGVNKAEKHLVYSVCCDGEVFKRMNAAARTLSCAVEQIRYESKVTCTVVVPTVNRAEFEKILSALNADHAVVGERYVKTE